MRYQCIKSYTAPFDFDAYVNRFIESQREADPRVERERRATERVNAGNIVDQRARQRMETGGGTYRDAYHAVLADDPKLRARYVFGDSA
jgi:hypothetical protein